jgi:hypothetical protein
MSERIEQLVSPQCWRIWDEEGDWLGDVIIRPGDAGHSPSCLPITPANSTLAFRLSRASAIAALQLWRKAARAGSLHPVDAQDRRVQDGIATPGILVVECVGGRYRGSCYQVAKAESRLREGGQSAVEWIGAAGTPLGLEDDLAGAEADL